MDKDTALRVIGIRDNVELNIVPFTLDDLADDEIINLAEALEYDNKKMTLYMNKEYWPMSCLDCGVDTYSIPREYYIVTDEVWSQAFPDRKPCTAGRWWNEGLGYLCIGCLEERIGRHLVPGDFPNFPINDPTLDRSERLLSRLRGDHA